MNRHMAVEPKIIGQRIRKKRLELAINQKELADRVGISPSAINQYEKADKIPSTETLVKLAQELGITTDYLLGATSEEELFLDASVANAFRDFKGLSSKDRQNIISNIRFLKENSSKKA